MNLFTKTAAQQQQFEQHIAEISNITEQLSFLSADDTAALNKLKETFQTKVDDFYRKDRKLNIGIIGQVKAGKSSFLNTMIFNGQDVLPRASTPKTATLTKIEYSEQNSIEISYYNSEEWKQIEERARVNSDLEEYRVAREILKLAEQNNVQPSTYLQKGTETRTFETESDLMRELNEYVGENGKLTALVKFVTLKVNNEALKDISIVDTPGMNDPIASRTDKTKQFMEVCDVVFFLSRASNFLDQTDMDLLTSQLPQKGVNRLVLIASRYDEALQDTIDDYDALDEADIDTKKTLRANAKMKFTQHIETLRSRNTNAAVIDVLASCKEPVFVSSMAHNMSHKDAAQYNEDEQLVFNNLDEHDDLDSALLAYVGNIQQVQGIFTEVIDQKEQTLMEKAKTFLPLAKQELAQIVEDITTLQKRRLALLVEHDQESLAQQKVAISSQIQNIKAATTSIFTDMFAKLETCKTDGTRALRQASAEYANLNERTGTETEERSRTVSTSKWYNPFSWGSSRTEYYTVETRYQYLDVSDALENLRNFGNDAVNTVEEAFQETIDFHQLKRRLLTTVIENFDTSSEYYDPAYFKLLTEKTIQAIELPVINIDISEYVQSMASGFSGEVRDASSKAEMRNKLSSYISNLFDEISSQFVREIKTFKEKMMEIDSQFTAQLLKNITDEYEIVLEQFNDKEQEIAKLREGIAVLENLYTAA